MSSIIIDNSQKIKGNITISGSKNGILPILCSSLLLKGKVKLKNIPHISDVAFLVNIINNFGSTMLFDYQNGVSEESEFSLNIDNISVQYKNSPSKMIERMRASILLLAPMLARFGKAVIALPGGCTIGARPIDLHLYALEKLGAEIHIKDGKVYAEVKNGFVGNEIHMPKSSVGATENAICGAVIAKGNTTIKNAAVEPEIAYLCDFLNLAGAKITGMGTDILEIEGVLELLNDFEYTVPADRIEAGTYAFIGALEGNDVTLLNCTLNAFDSIVNTLHEAGIGFEESKNELKVKRLQDYDKNLHIKTGTFPDFFPTDLQSQLATYLLSREGRFVIEENVFENRAMYVGELIKMGAKIELEGKNIIIHGKSNLIGTTVYGTDLRGAASCVMSGLMAKGTTVVKDIYHLDRGYDAMDVKLIKCGANLKRFC